MKRTNCLLILVVSAALAACGGASSPTTWSDPTGSTPTPDTTPPTRPTGLAASAVGTSAENLTWNASTDNIGVSGYVVKRNGTQIATPATTAYMDSGLSPGTTYTYTVAAFDAAGNLSSASTGVSVTTPVASDTTAPTQPTGFTAVATGPTGVNLSWTASTDNVGVTGYILRRNGTQIATPTGTGFADSGLTAATTYTYTVAARDAAGNVSGTATATVTTPSATASNSAMLAWDPVTAANLSGYRVYFGTAPGTYLQPAGQGVGVGNVTTYTVLGLSSATRYYFVVTATDTQGNESAPSNEVFKDIP